MLLCTICHFCHKGLYKKKKKEGRTKKERVGCRARLCGGIITQSHNGFCSDQVSFTNRRRAQKLHHLSSLLPSINLTAAAIRRGDRHCLAYVFCKLDWSWRGFVLSFVSVKLQRGKGKRRKRTGVLDECQ